MTRRQEAVAWLSRYTFARNLRWLKPSLEVDPQWPVKKNTPIHCIVNLTFPDSREGGGEFPTRTPFTISLGAAPDVVHREVSYAIAQRMAHEVQEGLLFDGIVTDLSPHVDHRGKPLPAFISPT